MVSFLKQVLVAWVAVAADTRHGHTQPDLINFMSTPSACRIAAHQGPPLAKGCAVRCPLFPARGQTSKRLPRDDFLGFEARSV